MEAFQSLRDFPFLGARVQRDKVALDLPKVSGTRSQDPPSLLADWGLTAAWNGTFRMGGGPAWAQPGDSEGGQRRKRKGSSEPTAAPGRQDGLASHRWAVRPAGMAGRCRYWLPSQPGVRSGGRAGGRGTEFHLGLS
jgi:hypothetical protein